MILSPFFKSKTYPSSPFNAFVALYSLSKSTKHKKNLFPLFSFGIRRTRTKPGYGLKISINIRIN